MESRPNRLLLFVTFSFVPVLSVLVTCVIFGLFLPIYKGLTGRELPRSVQIPILAITFAVTLFFSIRYILKDSNRYYVTIDNERIYFGRKKEIELPFREIVAIIAGLPAKMTSVVNANKYLNRRAWLGLVAERNRALLIINRDGSIIQFNIHRNKNGTSLMQEFANRNSYRMIGDYDYDDEQIALLKWPRWNRVCRSYEIERAFGDVRAQT